MLSSERLWPPNRGLRRQTTRWTWGVLLRLDLLKAIVAKARAAIGARVNRAVVVEEAAITAIACVVVTGRHVTLLPVSTGITISYCALSDIVCQRAGGEYGDITPVSPPVGIRGAAEMSLKSRACQARFSQFTSLVALLLSFFRNRCVGGISLLSRQYDAVLETRRNLANRQLGRKKRARNRRCVS